MAGCRYGHILALQRSAGNKATEQFIAASGLVDRLTVSRQIYAPKESPALTPATVKRAEQMKRRADTVELELKLAVRELSEQATPVIEEFRSNHSIAHKRVVDELLAPFLPDVDSLIGSSISVTLGFATYFLPQARALRAIGEALVTAVGPEVLEGIVDQSVEANRKAERAQLLAQWLSETKVAGEAAYRASRVVPSQYDAALDLMIAVAIPWVAKLRADEAGDQSAQLRAAASYVAVAGAFLQHAPNAARSMRALTASYKKAAQDNDASHEVRRLVALVAPSVLARRIPGHWLLLQSDRRPEFILKVLVPLWPDMSPARTAAAESYVVTVRQLVQRWHEFQSRPPLPTATIHYAGQALDMTGSVYAVQNRLQELIEASQQRSLPAMHEAAWNAPPSWIDDIRVGVNTYRPPSQSALFESATSVAHGEAAAARTFWNQMAGVP